MFTNGLRNVFIRPLLFCACAGWLTNACAGSFDYVEMSSEQIGFNPGHFVFDAGGAWVTGSATARFHADGSLAFVVPVTLRGGDALLAETADGGLVEAPTPIQDTPQQLPCSIFKLDSNGRRQWNLDIGGTYCSSLSSDDSGAIWVVTESAGVVLLRMDADGSGLAAVPLPSGFVPLTTQKPLVAPAGGIYLAGFSGAEGATSSASVLKLDANGALAWQWTDSSPGSKLTELGLDAVGNVYAVGSSTSPSAPVLAICSLTPAGTLRWAERHDATGADGSSGFEVAADGTSFVSTRSASSGFPLVEKINADGSLVWQHEIPLQGVPPSIFGELDHHAGLRIAPNGDVLALADSGRAHFPSVTTELVRFDMSGNVVATSVIDGRPGADAVGVSDMTILADSTVLLTTYSNFSTPDGAGLVNGASASGLFLHLDRSRHPLASPLASVDTVANGIVMDSVIDPDGTVYLLTRHLLTQFNQAQDYIVGALTARYALSRISPSGSKVWESDGDGYWWAAHLSEGAGRICIGGNRSDYFLANYSPGMQPAGSKFDTRIECHATDTGAMAWSSELVAPDNSGFDSLSFRALGNSTTVATYADVSGQVNVTTFDPGGNVSQTHAVTARGFPVGTGTDGSALLVAANDVPVFSVVRGDGTTLYERTLTSIDSFAGAEYLDDGTAEFLGLTADGGLSIGVLSTDGALQWTTHVADAPTQPGSRRFSATADAEDIFLALSDSGTGTQVIRLNRNTGVIEWRKTTDQASNESSIAVDPNGSELIFYNLYPHKIALQVVDRADGNIGAPAYHACGSADCEALSLQRAQVGVDGTLRIVLTSTDSSNNLPPDPPQVIGVASVAQSPALIPAAQPGVAGVWYAPYESGQGFLVDFIVSADVLFIPWFTYAQDAGNDPAGLAWFSLQGNAAPADTDVELGIYSNDRGIFQSGVIASHRVGTAHAGFSDCDHGSLSYQFDDDVNGGTSGLISIQRLLPSTSACNLANGATLPAENTDPASNGFDANQSGSWFDPDTSGQGIEFTVIPSGSGYSGQLFGAWFAYDPAGAGDDPLQQHWFTLQGDLSQAENARVSVPILRTIGGTFDGAPTGNTVRVGQATVAFVGCTSAVVDYRFDDTAVAHAYRNLSGRMNLSRLGGCAG
jgi:hypothetical protein